MMELVRWLLLIVIGGCVTQGAMAGVRTLAIRDIALPLALGQKDELVLPLNISTGTFQVLWITESHISAHVFLETINGEVLQNIRSRDFYLRRRVLLTHENCSPCRLRINGWTENAKQASIQFHSEYFSTYTDAVRLNAERKLQYIQKTIDAPFQHQYSYLNNAIRDISILWTGLGEVKEVINSIYYETEYGEGIKTDSLFPFLHEYKQDPILELLADYKQDTLFISLKKQLALARQQWDIFAIIRINIALGREEFYKGHYDQAKHYYRQALSLVKQQPKNDHKTLYLLGSVQHELGQVENKLELFSSAEDYLNSALVSSTKISDAALMADVLNTLGFMSRLQKKLSLATARHQVAFGLSEKTTDSIGLDMRTLYSMATVNVLHGRYFAALELLKKAEATASRYGAVLWRAHIVAARARAYLELGDIRAAKASYNDALALYNAVGAKADLPTVYTNLGRLYEREGDLNQSVHFFELAKSMSPELTGNEHKLNLAQASIAALIAKEEYSQAYREQVQLIEQSKDSFDKFLQGRNLSQLAEIAIYQGNYHEAYINAQKAIGLYKENKDDLNFIKGNYLAALSGHRLQYKKILLLPFINAALDTIESIRSTLLQDNIRREYFALQRSLYDLKIQILGESDSASEIDRLVTAESFKARTFYEKLIGEGSGVIFFPFEKTTAAQLLDDIFNNEVAWEKTLANSTKAFAAPQVLDYQKRLSNKEAVLYFFVGEQYIYAWFIQHHTITDYTIKVDQQFTDLLENVLHDLGHSPLQSSASDLQQEYEQRFLLSQQLLGPVSHILNDFSKLIVIPDSHLHRLPFSALINPVNDIPLIESHQVSYALSLATDAWLRGLPAISQPIKSMLVVAGTDDSSSAGNDLPGVSKEAAMVASLWKEKKTGEITSLVGNISTKQKLLALDLSQFQIMHFASHAKVNWDYPELTAILLTTENYTESNQLLLSEINRWKLHAELVVLSACETAAGKLVGGEGSMGLSRAFFEAGAKRVIASFWPVEDSSSAYLMEHFYRFLLLDNKNPVDALQQAQQAVSKVSRWSHPYYWSGMAYFGKPEAWRE